MLFTVHILLLSRDHLLSSFQGISVTVELSGMASETHLKPLAGGESFMFQQLNGRRYRASNSFSFTNFEKLVTRPGTRSTAAESQFIDK